jgi:hypothetical protein
MKLNDELATDFGTLITIALLKFVKENETEDFDDVQTELSNIIFEIKYGRKFDYEDYMSMKLLELQMQTFLLGAETYITSGYPLKSIIKILKDEIYKKSSSIELEYCQTTYRSFINKLVETFKNSHFPELYL